MDVIGHDHIASDNPVVGLYLCIQKHMVYCVVCQNTFTLVRTYGQENEIRAIAQIINRLAGWSLSLRQLHIHIEYAITVEGNAPSLPRSLRTFDAFGNDGALPSTVKSAAMTEHCPPR